MLDVSEEEYVELPNVELIHVWQRKCFREQKICTIMAAMCLAMACLAGVFVIFVKCKIFEHPMPALPPPCQTNCAVFDHSQWKDLILNFTAPQVFNGINFDIASYSA